MEIWLPGLDPKDDPLLAEIAQVCKTLPEIPAGVLAFAIEDAIRGNTAAAKRELSAWAASVNMRVRRKTCAPTLWVLHQDGFRYPGMPDDVRSYGAREVAVQNAEYVTCAHYDESILVDFWNFSDYEQSWTQFKAYPKHDPFEFADMIRRGEHGDSF
jgi:hypothetical protein